MAEPTKNDFFQLPPICPSFEQAVLPAHLLAKPAPSLTAPQRDIVKKSMETAQGTESEEVEKLRNMNQRYATKLIEGICELFVAMVADSQDLQLTLGITLKEGSKPDLQTVIMQMHAATQAKPVDKNDRDLKDFVIIEGKLSPACEKKLSVIYEDLKLLCSSFGIDLTKTKTISPLLAERLQTELEKQIIRYLESQPNLLKTATTVLTMVWMIVNTMSTLGLLDLASPPILAGASKAAQSCWNYFISLKKS